MNDLRTAAQQALEALIWTTGSADFGEGGQAREGALKLLFRSIDALRAALAQPDDWTRCHHCGQTMPPVPLTGLDMFLDPQDGLKPKRYKPKAEPVQEPIRLDCSSPLVVHPHPAFQTTPPKAEPVEPVAWMCSNPELMAKGYERFASRCEGDWNIPVYTSPPQRQPLTDEVAALTAQRDALLEALKDIAGTDPVDAALDPQRAVRIARAAIKAVEGTK